MRRTPVMKQLVTGEKEAKAVLATMPKPAYMGIRFDLGPDVYEVGTVEHNYAA